MRLLPVIALMFLTITAASAEETTVDAARMTEAVRQEFAEQGFGDNVEVEFFGGQTKFEFAPAGQVKMRKTANLRLMRKFLPMVRRSERPGFRDAIL